MRSKTQGTATGDTPMDTVTEIVQAHGYDSVHDMAVGDHIKVEHNHQMPLTIEKIGDNRLSVAHYYTQRGDLMSDPEVVFRLDGDTWVPVRYTQHPRIHHHDESGLKTLKSFVNTWDRNLRKQGFLEAATDGGEA